MQDPEVVKLVQRLHLLLSELNLVSIDLQRQGLRLAIDAEETGEKIEVTGYSTPIRKFVVKHLFQTVPYNDLPTSQS